MERYALGSDVDDEVFRLVLNHESIKTVEELCEHLASEFFGGAAVLKLTAINAGGVRVTLRPNQQCLGLFDPTDTLFANVQKGGGSSGQIPEQTTTTAAMKVDCEEQPTSAAAEVATTIHVKVLLHDATTTSPVDLHIPLDPATCTLLQLKKSVSESLGFDSFTPDMDADQIEKGATSLAVTVVRSVGATPQEVSLCSTEPLSSLRQQLASSLPGIAGPESIHYILINGSRLVECHQPSFLSSSSSAAVATVRDLVEKQMSGPGPSQLHLYGPSGSGLWSIDGLETFEVTVVTLSPPDSSALALCVASADRSVIEIKNPLLAMSTSEGYQRVSGMKELLFGKFLARHRPAGVEPKDIVVALRSASADAAGVFSSTVLADSASLEAAGVGSLSVIEISCPAFEAWAEISMKTVSVALSGTGIATVAHSVRVLPCDSIAVLGFRLHKTLQSLCSGPSESGSGGEAPPLSAYTSGPYAFTDLSGNAFPESQTLESVFAVNCRLVFSGSTSAAPPRRRLLSKSSMLNGRDRIDICLAVDSHLLHSTPTSDRMPLCSWGIGPSTTVWAVPLATTCPISTMDHAQLTYHGGKEGLFVCSSGWRFLVQRGGGKLRCNSAGLATLLSCLYVMSSHYTASENAPESAALYCYLLAVGMPPPCLISLDALLNGRTVSSAHIAFLAQGLFCIVRKMSPSTIQDSAVFENSRFALNHLVKNCRSGLVVPPSVPGIAGVYHGAQTDADAALDVRSHPVLHDLAEECVKVLSPRISSSTVAAAAFTAEQILLAHPTANDASECTVLRREYWPVQQSNAVRMDCDGDVDGDALSVLPMLESAHRRPNALIALFTVVPPLGLRLVQPPKLTRDLGGLLSVFVGRGKGGSGGAGDLNIFQPITGGQTSTTDQKLAKALNDITTLSADSLGEEQVPAKECIVVVLDRSNSMGKKADFQQDAVDEMEFIDKDTHENWQWEDGSRSDAASTQLSAPATEAALHVLRKRSYFRELKALAKTHGAETVLIEVCLLENWQRPRDSRPVPRHIQAPS